MYFIAQEIPQNVTKPFQKEIKTSINLAFEKIFNHSKLFF